MERLQRIFSSVGGGAGAGAGPQADTPQVDTSEQVYISSLALLKMLKHGALAAPPSGAGAPPPRRAAACAWPAEP
jgi:26S proteasome regulatory subunit N11